MSRHIYQGNQLIGVIAPCHFRDQDLSHRLRTAGYGFLKRARLDGEWNYYGALVNCTSAMVVSISYSGLHHDPRWMHVSGVATQKMSDLVFLNQCIDYLLAETGIVELGQSVQRTVVERVEARWRRISQADAQALTANAEHGVDFSRWKANRRISEYTH
jgi:hypothetical protein